MANTYRIIDGTITHPTLGVIVKENISYYISGVLEITEFYSKNGVVDHTIKTGYTNENFVAEPQAILPNELDIIIGNDN